MSREYGEYALLIRCSKLLKGSCRYRVVLDRNFNRLTRTIVRDLQLTTVHSGVNLEVRQMTEGSPEGLGVLP